MNQALVLIDRAIELGRQELEHLRAGDVDKAEALAFGRDEIMDQALGHQDLTEASLPGEAEQTLDMLVDRLMELKDLQADIIEEAKRLQKDIREDIRRADQEQKRHRGYGKAVRPPRETSVFVSRSS